ncbi:hypothetical protein QZM38_13770 [Burkholderia orbicola]|uniref:hypothetical protein n=1 Tax=Burkholderia orbicola TaxID=2978683 RepID=UPI00264CB89F|nr:hypothetical protein [Burkholderia orbicola]MDN7481893.1 hypothetical protein [Burkholderia orbicola]
MNEIKHTPGPWRVGAWCGQCTKPEHKGNHPGSSGPNPCVYEPVFLEGILGIVAENGKSVVSTSFDELVMSDADARLITAAPDMLMVLEMLAADADAGKVMIPSGLRLSIDAALIKAGRKAAPEPVRHVTIAGVDR